MLPIDEDFIVLYSAYGLVLVFLLFGVLVSNNKIYYKVNLGVYAVYFLVAVYVFAHPINFKYGGSLVVLFYSAIPVVLHAFILCVVGVVRFFKR